MSLLWGPRTTANAPTPPLSDRQRAEFQNGMRKFGFSLVLSRDSSPRELYEALDLTPSEEDESLFAFSVWYHPSAVEEKAYLTIDAQTRAAAMLDKEREDFQTSYYDHPRHDDPPIIKPMVALCSSPIDLFTALLALLGLPHHWNLLRLEDEFHTHLQITQRTLLDGKVTMAELCRQLSEPCKSRHRLRSVNLVICVSPELRLGCNVPLRPLSTWPTLRSSVGSRRIGSRRGLDKGPICMMTGDGDASPSPLVDGHHMAFFGDVLAALRMSFVGLEPELEEYSANLTKSVQTEEDRWNRDPEYYSQKNSIFLNAQVHNHLRGDDFLLNPLGNGSWIWISDEKPLPTSLVWKLLQSGSDQALSMGEDRSFQRPNERVHALAMTSTCKTILARFATRTLQTAYQRVAGIEIARRKAQFGKNQSSEGKPESRSRRKRACEESDTESKKQQRAAEPEETIETSSPSTAASSADSELSSSEEVDFPTDPLSPQHFDWSELDRSSTTDDSDQEPLEDIEASLDLASQPTVTVRSSCASESVPSMSRFAIGLPDMLPSAQEQERARQAYMNWWHQRRVSRLFDEWWASPEGSQEGTPEERRAAAVVYKTSIAIQGLSRPSDDVENSIESSNDSFELVDRILGGEGGDSQLDEEEFIAMDTTWDEVAEAMESLEDGDRYKTLMRDRFSMLYYIGFPGIVSRLRDPPSDPPAAATVAAPASATQDSKSSDPSSSGPVHHGPSDLRLRDIREFLYGDNLLPQLPKFYPLPDGGASSSSTSTSSYPQYQGLSNPKAGSRQP